MSQMFQNVENNKEFKQLPEKLREDIKTRADLLHEEMEAEAKKLADGRGFFSE